MKVQCNCSIEQSLKEEAKNRNLNISLILEEALRLRLVTKKSDCPEDQIKLKCALCGDIVEEGFLCQWKNKFYCDKCSNTCSGWKFDGHFHLKIPGFNNENLDIAKKISEGETPSEVKDIEIKEHLI